MNLQFLCFGICEVYNQWAAKSTILEETQEKNKESINFSLTVSGLLNIMTWCVTNHALIF